MDTLHTNRLNLLCQALTDDGLSQMIICDPLSIWYFTGVTVSPGERLYALYVNTSGSHKLILNRLFTVPQTGLTEVWMSDTDDCMGILASEVDAAADMGIDKNWPARFLLALMEKNPNVRYLNSSRCVDHIRAIKDTDEQEKMRAASRINDACMEKAAAFLTEGKTEKEVAAYIDSLYQEAGCEGNSFSTIVSYGAHAADPHHEPDDTPLKAGDCIVVDMGCIKDGYCSDMTRTFFCRTADEKYAAIHDLVREANEKAEAMIRPGVRFCDIDRTAREHIENGGYGEYFTHRLGHSIGLEDHEFGDVSSVNADCVQAGMTFSIEPGVYLPGEFGVRVEDLVLVTEDGCEILNHVEKKMEDRVMYHIDPTLYTGRLEKEIRTYDLLDSLNIPYKRIDHDALPTMESCHEADRLLEISVCKNLFLTNAQKTRFYLLLMPGSKKFKTKDLSRQIGSARLSFAGPEYMEQFLDITPGSLSVLGLMNDLENQVQLIIDQDVINGNPYIGCHPCINTSSLRIKTSDVLDHFLPAVHHDYVLVNLPQEEL